MTVSPQDPRIELEDLSSLCKAGLRNAGLAEAEAEIVTRVLVTNDTWGIHTHGVKLLRPLGGNLRSGRLRASAQPEVLAEGPAWALLDGQWAMPQVTGCRAMGLAIDKARSAGVGYCGVRRSGNFGTAAYYANLAAEQGMIGLAMTNADPTVTAPGGSGPAIGTNPLACAAPAAEEKPFLLDMAMSTVAAGKVFAAQSRAEPISPGWLVGPEGQPTCDASGFLRDTWLAPSGGHKGYGLAVMVEILTAVLTGASMTSQIECWLREDPGETNLGHAFVALDIAAFLPLEQFRARMDQMIRQIKATPRAPGADPLRLPGEMEWERREQALAEGLALPADVLDSLRTWAREGGVEPLPAWLQPG